jgi:hypothetical protein
MPFSREEAQHVCGVFFGDRFPQNPVSCYDNSVGADDQRIGMPFPDFPGFETGGTECVSCRRFSDTLRRLR